MRGQRDRGDRGQLLHAALRHRVGRKRRDRQQRVHRGHVDDDPAAALRDHLPGSRLHAEEGAFQIDADDFVEFLFGDLEDVPVAGDAGIVDHDVEPAELLHGGRNELVDVGALGDVADDGAQGIRPPKLGGRRGEALGINVRDHDLDAVVQESLRAGLADAACRAGDGGDLAG
ncbi:hypothetical protein ACVJGC_006085 [Bradyrhizobium diazoefficiens]